MKMKEIGPSGGVPSPEPAVGFTNDNSIIFDTFNRYNSETGQFTVPVGGAGLYFFYTSFFAQDEQFADFLIRVNGTAICQAECDGNEAGTNDNGAPSCAAVTTLTEGM